MGYALAVAYGSVMDRPDQISIVVVGDGESETGPTATAWHSHKYLDPKESGAVIPILHVNGFKISERTIPGVSLVFDIFVSRPILITLLAHNRRWTTPNSRSSTLVTDTKFVSSNTKVMDKFRPEEETLPIAKFTKIWLHRWTGLTERFARFRRLLAEANPLTNLGSP